MLPNSYMCIYGWLPAEYCHLRLHKANTSMIKTNATQKKKLQSVHWMTMCVCTHARARVRT